VVSGLKEAMQTIRFLTLIGGAMVAVAAHAQQLMVWRIVQVSPLEMLESLP